MPPFPSVRSTPGLEMARAVAHHPAVAMVLERFEVGRHTVFIVLDRDPENLLDTIYDAEGSLYGRFAGLPFDVRVMTLTPGWSPADLERQWIVHYERPHPIGASNPPRV